MQIYSSIYLHTRTHIYAHTFVYIRRRFDCVCVNLSMYVYDAQYPKLLPK